MNEPRHLTHKDYTGVITLFYSPKEWNTQPELIKFVFKYIGHKSKRSGKTIFTIDYIENMNDAIIFEDFVHCIRDYKTFIDTIKNIIAEQNGCITSKQRDINFVR